MKGQFTADRLVLVNSSFGWLSPWYRRLRIQSLPLLLSAVASPAGVTRESLILKLVSNRDPLSSDIVQRNTEIGNRHPVSLRTVSAQIKAAARYRPGEGITQVRPGGLVLCSENDRMVDCRCSHRIAEYFNYPLRTHPEAGHDLPLDDPEWTVKEVIRWLDRKTPGTSGAAS